MSTALVPLPGMAQPSQPVDPRLQLKQMVLDSVVSANSKRKYAQALDGLFIFAGGRLLGAGDRRGGQRLAWAVTRSQTVLMFRLTSQR